VGEGDARLRVKRYLAHIDPSRTVDAAPAGPERPSPMRRSRFPRGAIRPSMLCRDAVVSARQVSNVGASMCPALRRGGTNAGVVDYASLDDQCPATGAQYPIRSSIA